MLKANYQKSLQKPKETNFIFYIFILTFEFIIQSIDMIESKFSDVVLFFPCLYQ